MLVAATKLNVRSGPGTDFRELHQLNKADSVTVLETRGDWAYVDPPGGWVSRAYLAPETSLVVPTGALGIVTMFGEPGAPECSAGRVHLPAPLKLGWENASVTQVACHSRMERIFEDVFAEIFGQGHWPLLGTFDGIYNHRTTKSGKKVSTHSWGIAVDLNAATNPQGKPGDMPSDIVRIFEDKGFTWGGRWSGKSRDDMHFQHATGY